MRRRAAPTATVESVVAVGQTAGIVRLGSAGQRQQQPTADSITELAGTTIAVVTTIVKAATDPVSLPWKAAVECPDATASSSAAAASVRTTARLACLGPSAATTVADDSRR